MTLTKRPAVEGSLMPDMILLLSLEPIWVSWGGGPTSVKCECQP